jgi:hypothetical protein
MPIGTTSNAPPSYENPLRIGSLLVPYVSPPSSHQQHSYHSAPTGPAVSTADKGLQDVLHDTTFSLPIFSAPSFTLLFLPSSPPESSNLPSPGRGAFIEAKLAVTSGAANALWKRVRGEWDAYKARRLEDETLREWSFRVFGSWLARVGR